ncbi:MAG: NADH-quinone oxidoreductase subunit NuoK [Candidatus Thorarchaeota archaeon]
MATLFVYLLIVAALAAIGLYGLTSKRNVMRLFFSIEILMNAANLSFITFGRYVLWGISTLAVTGQALVLFAIALEAAEAAIALAIVLLVSRVRGTVDIRELHELEG